jgi:5'-methylthioinosine phosphorylase
MSNIIAIIGGSALPQLTDFAVDKVYWPETPFGKTSSSFEQGIFSGKEIIFFDRHGLERNTPPHKVNYRANMWALAQAGVTDVIGLSIVGGIRSDMTPGHFVFPNQLVDYTVDRANTCFEDDFNLSRHIDFTYPYTQSLRQSFIEAAQEMHLDYTDDATYAVTQGPRFETMAEVNRLERDGCDIVGMTAMPEALLARELNMRYASIVIVGSKAAGRTDGLSVSIDEIKLVVDASVAKMRNLVSLVVAKL